MADIFGDEDLFTEFDRQRPPSILKQKLDDEFRINKTVGISNGSVPDTPMSDYERRFCADNDVPGCGKPDTTDCSENSNFVHVSKLKQLENEVRRLRKLNIFFDKAQH